jgi:membrane-associated phospholipid phosphatase
MSEPARSVERGLLLAALICAFVFIISYLLFVRTPWGHQFDVDAYFGHRALSLKLVKLDSYVIELVSDATLLLAAMGLFVIAVVRRCIFVGVITVAAFGCAVAGSGVLKGLLPWHALVPDDALLDRGLQANNSYPSGHATIGTSLALSLLLISPSRWRSWLAVAAGCLSAEYSTSVLFTGWHPPSDALGSLAWSGFCFSLAAALAVRLRGRPRPAIPYPGHAVLGSAVLAILGALATWALGARSAPFLLLSGLIIAGAFALTAWYGWQLRAVDWRGC